MAIKSKRKNRKELLEDEYGEKGDPFKTTKQTLDDYGVMKLEGFLKKRINITNWLVKGILTLAAVISLLVAIMPITLNGKVNTMSNRIDSMQSPAFKTRYEDLGKAIITAYYNQDKPPVNIMSGVAWSIPNEEDEDTPSQEGNITNGSFPVHVENLALVRSPKTMNILPQSSKGSVFTNPKNEVLVYSGNINGDPYEFSISLIIPDIDDPTTLPYLASPPVMMPATQIVQTNETNLDTPSESAGYKDTKLNDFSVNAITEWASAYAQNDGDSLKRISGDQNPYHRYAGIGGFSVQGSAIPVWSYENNFATADNLEDDFIITRIQFNMVKRIDGARSDTQKEVIGSGTGEFVQTQTFDIMLRNFNAGTPNIVAWGPAGSWSSLVEFGNAVQISEKEAKDSSKQTESNEQNQQQETQSSEVVPTLSSQVQPSETSSEQSDNQEIVVKNTDSEKEKSSHEKKGTSSKSSKKSTKEKSSDKQSQKKTSHNKPKSSSSNDK